MHDPYPTLAMSFALPHVLPYLLTRCAADETTPYVALFKDSVTLVDNMVRFSTANSSQNAQRGTILSPMLSTTEGTDKSVRRHAATQVTGQPPRELTLY